MAKKSSYSSSKDEEDNFEQITARLAEDLRRSIRQLVIVQNFDWIQFVLPFISSYVGEFPSVIGPMV